ncbi:hypothetical protein CLU79DRAFT_838283 [Phycomyces nitens]|nr:hypothetical protein CLU79DRAFT_838283 [Phycomyces nitens]
MRPAEEHYFLWEVTDVATNDGKDLYTWEWVDLCKLSFPSEYDIGPQIRVSVSFDDIIDQPINLLPYNDLLMDFNLGAFSDVKITLFESETQDGPQYATISPLFKRFFVDEMDGAKKKEMVIYNINPSIFQKVLGFIYSSSYDVKDVYEAYKIIKAADRFQLFGLCDIMFKYLQVNLDKYNVWITWDLAVYYDSIETESYCQNIVRNNARYLLSSNIWIYLGPETVIRALEIDHLSPPVPERMFYEAVLAWREQALYSVSIKYQDNDHDLPDAPFTANKQPLENIRGYPETEEEVDEAFDRMLLLIRFNQMDLKYLVEKIEENSAVMKSPRCRICVFKATSFNESTIKNPCRLQDFSR